MNSSDLIPVGTVDELAPGQRKLAFINGRGVVLFNIDGTIHAIDDSCPHQGASVANGHLNGCVLSCPAHGLRFDLLPAAWAVRNADAREEEAQVVGDLRDGPHRGAGGLR